MTLRIPDLAVLLIALTVGGLAIYRGEAIIAAICLAIGMGYAAVILWRRWTRGDRR
jgi:hypothetical protein